MSRNMIVAKRYAKALFEAAADQKIVAEVEKELKLIVGLIEEMPDFKKFLEHPNIDNSNKVKLLTDTLKEQVSDIVFNTVKLIITRGRESILPSLSQYYVSIANEALGKADAIVYSPYELSTKESQEIAEQFGKLTGKKIDIQNVVDESILGGLRVRIGDRLYDGSLSGKLASLEKSLTQKAL
jgi:F-type H+-transporting ATPase subunit delta